MIEKYYYSRIYIEEQNYDSKTFPVIHINMESNVSSTPDKLKEQKEVVESILNNLSKSKFRASFHLKKADIEYIKEKGWETIQKHCHDFISNRLAPAIINNDGKQTPTHGHPVFIAQHACACCCRGCLSKWHKIKKGINISENDINEIVDLLMAWIHKEYENYKETDSQKAAKSAKKKDNKKFPVQLELF